MPKFSKSAISQFFKTSCEKQLKLHLSKGHKGEIEAMAMPPSQPQRPGFADVAEAGDEWEIEKLSELREHLGKDAVRGRGELRRHKGGHRFEYVATPLEDPAMLPGAEPGTFLAQARFPIESEDGLGTAYAVASGLHDLTERFGLEIADAIPDLIQVLAPRTFPARVLASGDVEALPPGDERIQLRVVDIKMTAEPGAGYFAEVTYYTMALAGWLEDIVHGESGLPLCNHYVVVPEAAIWPGSHETSALINLVRCAEQQGRVATAEEKLRAWASELQETVFDAFRFEIDHLIRGVLSKVLQADWRHLSFHVTPSCKNCDYLGYPWKKADGTETWHRDHCWPTGEGNGGHLSRIPRLSRGATEVLTEAGHDTVHKVAGLHHSDRAFDVHQSLRAARTVIAHRAASLDQGFAGIAPESGTSASMPRFVNLKVFVTASFDVSSALTVSFGLSGDWMAQVGRNPATRRTKRFRTAVFVSDHKDVDTEYRELTNFLVNLGAILSDREIRDWERTHNEQCRMQVYIWDQLTYDHLCRVVGRHLGRLLQGDGIKHLAWLFPSEELLPNPDHSSRASPITVLENVVRATVVVPLPHHYSLMGVARAYHPARIERPEALLGVHPMFEDKLSDQIPSERAIEIWQRKPNWAQTTQRLVETVERQHTALSVVLERLEQDLSLSSAHITAPLLSVGAASIRERLSLDGHLWLTFARLNQAMSALEKETIRAMPVHEREARAKSARLTVRLTGVAETKAFEDLGVRPRPGRRVYALAETSADVSMREGDMGFALCPMALQGFLDRSFFSIAENFGIEVNPNSREPKWKMADALAVTPVRVDRERKLIILDESIRRPGILDELEEARVVDLSRDVMLDPVESDFFLPVLHAVLLKVGRPPEAVNKAIVMVATGLPAVIPGRPSKSSPLSRFLWTAHDLSGQAAHPVSPATLALLKAHGIGLNRWQEEALVRSLARRLYLVWGPPGTGKSHTLIATITAALLQARADGRRLRVLVTAFTWSAIDNLMPDIVDRAERVLPGQVEVIRFASPSAPPSLPDGYPAAIIMELNRHEPSHEVRVLRETLTAAVGQDLVVVGSTANQVVNLIRAGHARGKNFAEELFDLVVIDEGSQLDVAHAALALTGLATGGSVVCAGDPLQMAPIHKAQPPLGLEHMVGSVYEFLRRIHHVPETQLNLNYRSNRELVDCFRHAGYGEDLRANAPSLRMRLLSIGEESAPSDWPSMLAWSPHLDTMLHPERPVSCLVHRDGMSAQSSDFEARLVVALVWRLWCRLIPGLAGEVDHEGQPKDPIPAAPPDATDFWARRIGIVTPHRAQQGMVVNGLTALFAPLGHDPEQIRKAVDTVERFQGQERDVMLASYAVGDPDTVADEEEFLHSLNRFNVMVSRARAKLLVVVTQELVSHLSDDIDIVRQSRLLKYFVEAHCCHREQILLPWLKRDGSEAVKEVSFRSSDLPERP